VKPHTEQIKHAISEAHAACDILATARPAASNLGVKILRGAHAHIYGAMLADLADNVRGEEWIGPFIKMPDSSIKPTEDFLIDHLFAITFVPIAQRTGGPDFLRDVKRRAMAIVYARKAKEGRP